MTQRERKRFLITAAVLLALGAAVPLCAARRAQGLALASDVLFAQASLFLVWGLIRHLVNMRMFTSAAWGVKSLRRLWQGRAESAQEMKDGYLHYRNTRPRHADAKPLLCVAAALMLLSALLAVM